MKRLFGLALSLALLTGLALLSRPYMVRADSLTTQSINVLNGQASVTSSAANLGNNAIPHGLCVEALSTNTASIFVGNSNVSTSNGLELLAKASVCLQVANTNLVYVVAGSTQTATWISQ